MIRTHDDTPEYCEECGTMLDKHYVCPACRQDADDHKDKGMMDELMTKEVLQ